MEQENRHKQEHGEKNKKNLQSLIETYTREGHIAENISPYKTGYPNFDKKQFKLDHLITFRDGEVWGIHTTSTIRTDRAKQIQWDSYHIKEINQHVNKVYLVFPEGLDHYNKNQALSYQKKIREKKMYTAIDDVLSLSELEQRLESKSLENEHIGKRKATEGKNFEKRLVSILNHSSNIEKWNQSSSTEDGYFYPTFQQIMSLIGLSRDEKIREIEATDKIPRLETGGQPKTDILLTITTDRRSEEIFTFSCKRSSAKYVSIHEYTAESFIEVLDIKDKKLQEAFLKLQEVGGFTELKKRYDDLYKVMEKELPILNKKLAEWAYAGIGGYGDPKIHWANYIIVFKNDTKTLEMEKIDVYIANILQNVEGQMGTSFQWTYPSKKKGKAIQLKGKIT
ncbi:MspI family type II restriction endonuclease [Anoxybacillus sp. ST4]|uniref:MspI family type II restriction endonuclease n=1 Tax=Anoxybacillus sp. ST4 TaxID=2864181 RepID=UPI001C63E9DC|nr:MspI family type II restriction endonuclease [Anoxybacillus sp. ST4]MBW7651163.1 MspI family type II restriction endonuclease [Anoxybacillus sp. ST4]